MFPPPSSDALIAGAGLIGLSLALELAARGAQVAVLDIGRALGQASSAAAGMLAVKDPHNPSALYPLSQLSSDLYPGFLEQIYSLSGLSVPFQTDTTFQYAPDGQVNRLAERSLDPRQLGRALRQALRTASVAVHEDLAALRFEERRKTVFAHAAGGKSFQAPTLVDASGAWAAAWANFNSSVVPILPRKGQMLRVALPASLPLREVHRSEPVYIVPRTSGPQAGSALIGATVENAGFDLSTRPADLAELRSQASLLLPQLADASTAPQIEAWAGLRPSTIDLLPLLGRHPHAERQWIASGHFRNGVLLAPATAKVIADLLEGKQPALSLDPFSPARFAGAGELQQH